VTPEEVQAWARQCADVTRGRMPETEVWDAIAKGGREFEHARKPDGKPDRGQRMTPRECFSNSARTVLGLTAVDRKGLQYAEGFALSHTVGMWFHHGWVVNTAGLAVDRTWDEPADRYVGVIVEKLGTHLKRPPGTCQLATWPVGIPWGQNMVQNPEAYDRLFGKREVID
jgi:hypothetical protein